MQKTENHQTACTVLVDDAYREFCATMEKSGGSEEEYIEEMIDFLSDNKDQLIGNHTRMIRRLDTLILDLSQGGNFGRLSDQVSYTLMPWETKCKPTDLPDEQRNSIAKLIGVPNETDSNPSRACQRQLRLYKQIAKTSSQQEYSPLNPRYYSRARSDMIRLLLIEGEKRSVKELNDELKRYNFMQLDSSSSPFDNLVESTLLHLGPNDQPYDALSDLIWANES